MSALGTTRLIVTAVVIAHAAAMHAQTVDWKQVSTGYPSGRCCMGIAYDGAAHAAVLFGGAAGGAIYGDTWSWRGKWFTMSPAASPPARQGPGMACDAATGNTVLFGGSTAAPVGTGTSLNDTWTWDGTTWTQQFPPVSPSPRTWSSMASDPVSRTVVLFGGNNLPGGDGPLGDTWTWDGIARTWTQRHPTNHPSARGSSPLAYDQTTHRLVLFGGVTTNFDNLNDTWNWDGSNWIQQFPTSAPSARNSPAMAYDPGLAAVVLFGGSPGPCCSYNNDTWTWDGVNWTEIYPANTLPPGRNSAGMAYDTAYQALLLFGGQADGPFGDTWLLTLAP
ncbi:MAG: hypothetical protein ABSH24_14260 [Bryobacteraceae bacterium]|jgi:hypothetical protein